MYRASLERVVPHAAVCRVRRAVNVPRLGLIVLAVLATLLAPAKADAQELSHLAMAQAMEKVLIDAIAGAERSVVAIARVRKGASSLRVGPGLDGRGLFDARQLRLSAPVPTNPDFVPSEFATGVVLDREGHILTAYHVLGDPEENDYYVWVQRKPFQVSRVEVPVRIEAGDPWTDLAVLTIPEKNLEPIKFAEHPTLRKGMIVIALGNPYAIARDGQPSATWGIIANLQRAAPPHLHASSADAERDSIHHFGTLIQTDARLQLGTSGGALINLKGEMIGLTTSLAALAGYERSAGFAIPIDDAFRKTIKTLKQGRHPTFGFLGVEPDHLSLRERQQGRFGTRVLRVLRGTPADRAGLRMNDVITHVDGRKVTDKNALFRELSKLPAETHVKLTIERSTSRFENPHPRTATVVLAKKYVATGGKPFAQVKPRSWRGMRVEYPSALPPRLRVLGFDGGDSKGCVAVLDVVADSPAWEAGLRRGQYISHVGNRRVTTPGAFYQAVTKLHGDVRLHLISSQAATSSLVVPSAAPAARK